jgi:hypothetical protein
LVLVWCRRVSRVLCEETEDRSGIVRELWSVFPVNCEILNRWRRKDWNSKVCGLHVCSALASFFRVLDPSEVIPSGAPSLPIVDVNSKSLVESRGNRGSTRQLQEGFPFEGLSEDHSHLSLPVFSSFLRCSRPRGWILRYLWISVPSLKRRKQGNSEDSEGRFPTSEGGFSDQYSSVNR